MFRRRSKLLTGFRKRRALPRRRFFDDEEPMFDEREIVDGCPSDKDATPSA